MPISISSQRGGAVPAPEWETTRWFNSDPLSLADLRGRVVVLEAFQMLCPACVRYGLPQVAHLAGVFRDEVTVVGLHTVFEHHDAMTPTSLASFLYQYRVPFPVAVDAYRGRDPEPVTFARYEMRGTPTTVLIDRDGRIRGQHLGETDDMVLAAAVARLVDESPQEASPQDESSRDAAET